jgi:hypothetical protein
LGYVHFARPPATSARAPEREPKGVAHALGPAGGEVSRRLPDTPVGTMHCVSLSLQALISVAASLNFVKVADCGQDHDTDRARP